jgi:3-oxoacyl-[acyl-carrier-protein] synthase III
MYATVSSIAHYLPADRLTNEYFERRLDTSDEWIWSRTGIRERRRAFDGATSDLIVPAAIECLRRRKIDASEIDCIVVATMSPDRPTPSTATIVQRKLGARNAWAFDVSAACSGFVFGLTVATKLVESGAAQRLLFCCGEKMSSIIDPEDRATAVLFGDGAAALLIEPTHDSGVAVLDSLLSSDGAGEQELYTPAGGSASPASTDTLSGRGHYLKQNGPVVFKAAVNGMERVTRELLDRNGLDFESIDCFVPHQANQRIIDAVGARLGIPSGKIRGNVERYGNTASASIPICLSELHETGDLRLGDSVLVTSFGAGFTMGAVHLRWGVAPLEEPNTVERTARPRAAAGEPHRRTASSVGV